MSPALAPVSTAAATSGMSDNRAAVLASNTSPSTAPAARNDCTLGARVATFASVMAANDRGAGNTPPEEAMPGVSERGFAVGTAGEHDEHGLGLETANGEQQRGR